MLFSLGHESLNCNTVKNADIVFCQASVQKQASPSFFCFQIWALGFTFVFFLPLKQWHEHKVSRKTLDLSIIASEMEKSSYVGNLKSKLVCSSPWTMINVVSGTRW